MASKLQDIILDDNGLKDTEMSTLLKGFKVLDRVKRLEITNNEFKE